MSTGCLLRDFFDQCLRQRHFPVQFFADRRRRNDFKTSLREQAMQIHRSALRKLALSAIILVAAGRLGACARHRRLRRTPQGRRWPPRAPTSPGPSVTENGTQVVLEGVTFGMAGKPEKANLGNVTLDNITEANGGYKIGTLALPGLFDDRGRHDRRHQRAPPSPGLTLPAAERDRSARVDDAVRQRRPCDACRSRRATSSCSRSTSCMSS